MSQLKLADLVTALSATDGKIVAATCEALYRYTLAEGFNRFHTTSGQRQSRWALCDSALLHVLTEALFCFVAF